MCAIDFRHAEELEAHRLGCRLVINTASTPPTRTAAQSPSGTRLGPKVCQQSRARHLTSTMASIGAPDAGAVLPPKRSGNCAPCPASKHRRTAMGSQIGTDCRTVELALDKVTQDVRIIGGRATPALSSGSAITTARR